MAQGFFEGMQQGLPQGVQLGMQGEQLLMQRRRMEQQGLAQANETLQSILKQPPGPLRKYMLGMARKQWQMTAGEDMPDEFWGTLEKANEEEVGQLQTFGKILGEQFPEMGMKDLPRMLMTPQFLAPMLQQAMKSKQEQRQADEVRKVLGGGESVEDVAAAPPGGPLTQPSPSTTSQADRTAWLQSRIAALSSFAGNPLADKKLDDFRQELSLLQSEGDRERKHALDREKFEFDQRESILSPEGFARRQALAAAGKSSVNIKIDPNTAGERENLVNMRVNLDKIDQLTQQLDDPKIAEIYGSITSNPTASAKRLQQRITGKAYTPEQHAHRSQLMLLNARLINELAGKATTEHELRLAEGFRILEGDNSQTIKGKMQGLRDETSRKLSETYSVMEGSNVRTPRKPIPPPPGGKKGKKSDDDLANEYLRKHGLQ